MQRIEQASILVVDSDVDCLFSVASILLAQRHRVVTARDLRQANVLANNEPLDLVIAGTRLKTACGIGFVSRLKKAKGMANLPVMFLSANQIPDVILRQHSFGDIYHIRKPINLHAFTALVRTTLTGGANSIHPAAHFNVPEPHVSLTKTKDQKRSDVKASGKKSSDTNGRSQTGKSSKVFPPVLQPNLFGNPVISVNSNIHK